MIKKHANIPIFIPHEGCPNGCVFCNQKKITGTALSAKRDITCEIEKALSTIDEKLYDTEIAFFGGSFTGIDREDMVSLLSQAYSFIKSGRVSSIRLSTRPDYINEEILSVLSEYGVKHIELGVQSTSDRVLAASLRGHTAQATRKACREIVERGFVLGGQMMIGLPESTAQTEIETAREICRLGAREARIYPTVVFCGTKLCDMTKSGEYTPLELTDAVERAARCYRVFLQNGVKVLRVGLQSSENLSDKDQVLAGANHPALGELCEGLVYRDIIVESLEKTKPCGSSLFIEVPYGEVSKVVGHKKENKSFIKAFLSERGFEAKNIKIIEKFDEKFRVNTYFE